MNSNTMMVPTATTTITATTTANTTPIVTTRRQEVSSSSASSSSSPTAVAVHVRVQTLNNLGCIYVLKGKHLEAKCTFESALQLLRSERGGGRATGRATVAAAGGVVGVHDSTIYDYGYYGTNNNDEEFESTLLSSTYICRDDDGHHTDTIKRMTTTSRLCTVPYAGQQQYKQDKQKKTKNSTITTTTSTTRNKNQEYSYHQIYCLPLVMDDEEWAVASTEGKALVLIFNTALSFHLLGISSYLSLASIVEQGEQEGNNNQNQNQNLFRRQQHYQHCVCDFLAAKKLYTVVLENIRTLFECGVNKVCHIALFNNISHVCKSLAAAGSPHHVRELCADYYQEAYAYDLLLLKAIYWYRDSNDDSSSRTSGMNSSSSGSSENPDYAESDVEIMDSFLENVFYLMGAPEHTVPASAA